MGLRSFTTVVPAAEVASLAARGGIPELVLTYHERRRTRFGATLASGEDIGVALPRGTVLAPGDVLQDAAAGCLRVAAARETLSVVRSGDRHLLMRAAYHLGNRHVALQIGEGELAYLHDHVLDDLVRALGLSAEVVARPFEAEPGPYGQASGHGDAHGHRHDHDHDHVHQGVEHPRAQDTGSSGDLKSGRSRP